MSQRVLTYIITLQSFIFCMTNITLSSSSYILLLLPLPLIHPIIYLISSISRLPPFLIIFFKSFWTGKVFIYLAVLQYSHRKSRNAIQLLCIYRFQMNILPIINLNRKSVMKQCYLNI